jgi:hypothetical protein
VRFESGQAPWTTAEAVTHNAHLGDSGIHRGLEFLDAVDKLHLDSAILSALEISTGLLQHSHGLFSPRPGSGDIGVAALQDFAQGHRQLRSLWPE